MSSNMSLTGTRPLLLLAFGVFAILSLSAPDLWAQDAPAAAAEGGDAVKEPTSLMRMIIDAGIFMVPIAALSVWGITLSAFLLLQLNKNRYIPARLKNEILDHMSEVKVRSAIDIASQDSSFLGRLATGSLIHVDATDPDTLGRAKVEDAMSDFVTKESLGMSVLIGYISIIAQTATMVGLFGTVAGMVLAFDTMGLSGGSDPGALAANISMALITTAGGLVVAIPSIIMFYVFKNRYNKLVSDAQNVVIEGLESAVATINADQALSKVPEGIAEV